MLPVVGDARARKQSQCPSQKRPTVVSKETYCRVKRDLPVVGEARARKQSQCPSQKRPTVVSKETYCSVKRDLKKSKCPSHLHVKSHVKHFAEFFFSFFLA